MRKEHGTARGAIASIVASKTKSERTLGSISEKHASRHTHKTDQPIDIFQNKSAGTVASPSPEKVCMVKSIHPVPFAPSLNRPKRTHRKRVREKRNSKGEREGIASEQKHAGPELCFALEGKREKRKGNRDRPTLSSVQTCHPPTIILPIKQATSSSIPPTHSSSSSSSSNSRPRHNLPRRCTLPPSSLLRP
jgi:hypothetical protein